MEDRMDKLIELFNELEIEESSLLDIITDEDQSLDIVLAALITLLAEYVESATDRDFYEYAGLAFDNIFNRISEYTDDTDMKAGLYRGIIKYAAENLENIYEDDQEEARDMLTLWITQVRGTLADLQSTLDDLRSTSDNVEPEWDWPIINPSPVTSDDSSLNSSEFRDRSALRVFGYSVAKTSDWSTETRHRFLNDFMRMELPKVIEEEFGTEYGSPLTTTRLRKVANLLANNCSLRIRRDPDMFSVSIENWETDQEFLKTTFYEGEGLKFTPWPDPRDMEY
tara:strand:+ start:50 stop:895 length:846 start_codon:yes stop_codon:yes gene_type:complete